MSAPRYQWQPTTAEIAATYGLELNEVERFDHNTSPFRTDWLIDIATDSLRRVNEYPGASYKPIREAAAELTGLQPDQIVPGAGVDELILLAARAFLDRGDTAVAATPTYPLYEIATAQVGAVFQPVPAAAPEFAYPADAMIRAARDADLVWVCAPSNPIGNAVAPDTVEALIAATDGLVVVDAAYAEFGDNDWSNLVDSHHNAVVLRTLSKAFGMAGARVGYAMAHPSLVTAVDGIRPPGSISSISVEIAVAAIKRPELMTASVRKIRQLRESLSNALARLGMRVLPSETNFVLCEVGSDAHRLSEQLMGHGLVVRRFAADGPLADYLRFTVRSAEANSRLIKTLERYLP